MKKILFVLAALVFMGSTVSFAQDKKDKAAAKAEKAEKKAKEKAAKADKNAEKMAKLRTEYEAFLKDYKALEATGDQGADALLATVNTLNAGLGAIYQKVGYIEIETEEFENELGEKDVKIKRVYDRQTGQDVDKETAKSGLNKAVPEIVAMSATVAGLGTQLSKVANPQSLMKLGLKGKDLVKHTKMVINAFPMIKNQLEENKKILETK